jgi:hypothetical protein
MAHVFVAVKDSSGIRIHYTEDLRQYDGGILVNGITITPFHIVPPYQPEYRTAGYCSSHCTHRVRFNTTVSVVLASVRSILEQYTHLSTHNIFVLDD